MNFKLVAILLTALTTASVVSAQCFQPEPSGCSK